MKRLKTFLTGFFLLFFALLIIARLYFLQIQKGEYYEALALGQQASF